MEKNRQNITSYLVYGVIFFTLLFGAAYTLYLGDTLRFYDEKEYYLLAKNLAFNHILSFDGLIPTAWRPPGYPLFLAFFLNLGANVMVLRYVNFIALAICVYITYLIVKRNSEKEAVVAAVLFPLYPVLYYTAGTLYPQTLGMTLLLLATHLLFSRKQSPIKFGIIGLIYGFLLLLTPTFVVPAAVTFFWILAKKKNLQSAAVMAVVSLAVLSPWIVRNYYAFDKGLVFSTNGGLNLYLGNSKHTNPEIGVNIKGLEEYQKKTGVHEVDLDKHFRNKALAYMLENKKITAEMYIVKFFNHFHAWNQLATKGVMTQTFSLVMMATYWSLLLLCLLRLAMHRKIPLKDYEIFALITYLGFAAFIAIFFSRIRFRLPYDPYLFMLAAPVIIYFLTQKIHKYKRERP